MEWRRCKYNSIHFTGLFSSNITSYDNVMVGSNVKAPLKRSKTNGSSVYWHKINLSEIRGGYTIITATTHTYNSMIQSNSVILIDST